MRYRSVCDAIGAAQVVWQPVGARVRVEGRDSNRGHVDLGSASGQTVAAGAIAAEPVLDERRSADTELSGPKKKEVME
jgi:hypothetical protein